MSTLPPDIPHPAGESNTILCCFFVVFSQSFTHFSTELSRSNAAQPAGITCSFCRRYKLMWLACSQESKLHPLLHVIHSDGGTSWWPKLAASTEYGQRNDCSWPMALMQVIQKQLWLQKSCLLVLMLITIRNQLATVIWLLFTQKLMFLPVTSARVCTHHLEMFGWRDSDDSQGVRFQVRLFYNWVGWWAR